MGDGPVRGEGLFVAHHPADGLLGQVIFQQAFVRREEKAILAVETSGLGRTEHHHRRGLRRGGYLQHAAAGGRGQGIQRAIVQADQSRSHQRGRRTLVSGTHRAAAKFLHDLLGAVVRHEEIGSGCCHAADIRHFDFQRGSIIGRAFSAQVARDDAVQAIARGVHVVNKIQHGVGVEEVFRSIPFEKLRILHIDSRGGLVVSGRITSAHDRGLGHPGDINLADMPDIF
ncbi:MAG: hypothetical protein GMKNLPBB_03194 [Myxococcota bacterium]|nr:hypothetical protein [Myxococcota bacterium]